jgi:uncharacterized protein (TIGR03083 family)
VEESRFADCLAEEYSLLRDAAAATDLDAVVPCCPGWSMGDLVFHVARAYLHKVAVIRTGQWPRSWPPPGLAAEPRLALLARAYGELTAEFAARDPAQPALTWYEPDETIGFWVRRMAQETVIHRIDAELTAGLPSVRVPDDLALDGVDEVLVRFLACFSPGAIADADVEHPASFDPDADAIVVTSAGRSWTVRPSSSNEVTVTDGAASRAATRAELSAPPDPMLRWLWGRIGDDAITVDGDPAWAAYLRRLLAATTQ